MASDPTPQSADRTLAYVYDSAYAGFPNWEIGRPQWAFVDLINADVVRGPILDVGCGTGELTLYLARRGYDVLGVDISSVAIRQARTKAAAWGIDAPFLVWDALALDQLADAGFSFRTVLDSAMYHIFGSDERERFVDGLSAIVPSGGVYCVLGDARRPGDKNYGIHPEELHRRFVDDGVGAGGRQTGGVRAANRRQPGVFRRAPATVNESSFPSRWSCATGFRTRPDDERHRKPGDSAPAGHGSEGRSQRN